jgi:hypothetical protein
VVHHGHKNSNAQECDGLKLRYKIGIYHAATQRANLLPESHLQFESRPDPGPDRVVLATLLAVVHAIVRQRPNLTILLVVRVVYRPRAKNDDFVVR